MNEERMDPVEKQARIILIAQIVKSIVLIILGCVTIVGLGIFLYDLSGQWEAATGLSWPFFLLVEAALMVVAYRLGWLPEVDRLRAALRGKR